MAKNQVKLKQGFKTASKLSAWNLAQLNQHTVRGQITETFLKEHRHGKGEVNAQLTSFLVLLQHQN